MGIWDSINSTTEACKTCYGYCYSAGGEVVNAVISNSQRVSNYIPDHETRSQIGLFAYKFAQNSAKYALQEGFKLVPGGKALGEIVNNTMRDVKSEQQNKLKMEAVKETIGGGAKEQNSTSRNLIGRESRVEMQSGGGVELGDAKANQSPEETLRIFMMEGFMGNRFADEMLLPQIKYVKEKSQVEIKSKN